MNPKDNSDSPSRQIRRGFYICFTRRIPNLITIYRAGISAGVIHTFQRLTTKLFSSFDYNPDTTRDHSIHK